jgi:hypothetical protein
MGGLINPAPGGTGQTPTVTPPDLVSQAQQHAEGLKQAGWAEHFWAALFAGVAKGVLWVINELSRALSTIVAITMRGFTEAQGQENPEFDDAVAAVMSDLMGVEFSSDLLKRARAKGGKVPEMREVGGQLLKTLLAEFGGDPALLNAPGAKPAEVFLGFLMSFAVRQGNVAFLSELLTLRYGDQFRAYGENMAGNLGLGRLARMALRPFIDDLVAKPLQDVLRAGIRPTDLAANEAIKAFNRGAITQGLFQKTMQNLGYSDELITALQLEYLGQLNSNEILTLLRWGTIDQATATAFFKQVGFGSSTADFIGIAHNQNRADTAVSDYLTTLREQVRLRFIDPHTYAQLLDVLPLPDTQKEMELRIAGQWLSVPARRLTLAEMRKLYYEGLIALSDFTDFVQAEGYSLADQQLLTLDLLTNSDLAQDKLAAAQLRADLVQIALETKVLTGGLVPPTAEQLAALEAKRKGIKVVVPPAPAGP